MQPVSKNTIQGFYRAYGSGEPSRLAEWLADDVEWIISGPVDVLPFCGHRRGKEAALDVIERLVPSTFKMTGFDPHTLLIDGDRAATLLTLTGILVDGGRKISYRVAHFLRFRGEKILEFRSIIDSFDAAQQVLGHVINTAANEPAFVASGDHVAL